MNSFNTDKNKSKRKNGTKLNVPMGIYGLTKPGKYYFPGKISSGLFDGNGFSVDADRRVRTEQIDELYDSSVEREYDPYGMYTGRPQNDFDRPVQDADDL